MERVVDSVSRSAVVDGRGIVLSNVSRTYVTASESVHAVDGVSLTLHRGEFACIFGPSGCGKTTLLNLIGGLDVPDSGEVMVAGSPVGSMSWDERSRLRLSAIGMIFQGNNLIEEFTAVENVAIPLRAQGVAGRRARARAVELLDLVGVAGLADRYPSDTSGGQQQRIGIARALAGDRPFLLADEPTGSLDMNTSRELFALLHDLCRVEDLCVVMVTHDLSAREFADRIYTMRDGKLWGPYGSDEFSRSLGLLDKVL